MQVLAEALGTLDIGRFRIKLNHRRLLDAMMRVCGVPAAKFRPICSAIDKLDKEPWAAVRAEMVDQKGLSPEARTLTLTIPYYNPTMHAPSQAIGLTDGLRDVILKVPHQDPPQVQSSIRTRRSSHARPVQPAAGARARRARRSAAARPSSRAPLAASLAQHRRRRCGPPPPVLGHLCCVDRPE